MNIQATHHATRITHDSTGQPHNSHPANNAPKHLDRIDTTLSSALTAGLDIKKTNLPAGMLINPNLMHSFIYNEHKKQWAIGGEHISYLSPFNVGTTLPDLQSPVTFFSISGNNWVPSVSLPEQARDDDVIIFHSSANKSTALVGNNISPPAPHVINQENQYIFRYAANEKLWKVERAPHTVNPEPALEKTIAVTPEKPRQNVLNIPLRGSQTSLSLDNTSNANVVALPKHANDRDRVSLTSTAAASIEIDPSHINNPGPMQLAAGEKYDFMYFAKTKKWEVLNAPEKRYNEQQLPNGSIPPLTTPKTWIDIESKEWQGTVILPSTPESGSRVIVRSNSNSPGTIDCGDFKQTLQPGETISFKADTQGRWTKETVTIDLLLLYSDKARKQLGAPKMISRLNEGLARTNEALENSGANFRCRSVGIKEVTAKKHWKELIHPLSELRSDPTVQNWRNTLKADGVYYEGVENNYGGQAYVKPNADYMIGVGSIDAPTTVMRHELGHNMGINHGGESNSYAQGNSALRTIMGGNDIPYYSTPHRYTPDGQPLGIENKIDAVRAMNEFSSTVAGYR